MRSSNEEIRNSKIIVLSERDGSRSQQRRRGEKLSSSMAMLLGGIATLEIMTAAAMLLNIDIHTADRIALVFAFVVLYFAVVAFLTDK
ncbi:MAG: hypothetical protein Q4C91_07115 [Eubacteriales bacterium]|nr:hypothetical protein [Eubacteriales bacterium]